VVKIFEGKLVMYIYAETPIHPGSGTMISEAVDLPIQREKHTDFPIIQAPSLKGVLRNSACFIEIDDKCKKCDKKSKVDECEILNQIFGNPEGIGGVSITDARILAFPVRTLKGVFGWITCPLVLDRYKRDLNLAGIKIDWSTQKLTNVEEAKVCKNSNLMEKEYIYIEDLQLKCSKDDEDVNKIAQEIVKALPDGDTYKEIKEKLKKDLVIVSDEVFADFVSLTTEVITRIRISSKTGTVERESGGLWSEEYLPTDTLMYSLILIPSRLNSFKLEEIQSRIMRCDEKILQIGGDETIGKGFVRIKLVKGEHIDVKKP
jgi:CRISPR-associated protein Cmr4